MKPIATIAALAVSWTLFAEKMPFERYQSIIDRQPFGQPPMGFNPQQMASEVSRSAADDGSVPLSAEQEKLQKAVGFSVINVESDGSVMVGFSDKSDSKSPKHYYMRVGEERDGWLVKDGDPVKKSMTVVKDSVEITLDLGSNSTAAADTKQGGKPGAQPPAATRSPLLARNGAAAGGSYQSRKARREAEEAQERAAAAAREAARAREEEEAKAKEAEEKAVRDAERAEQRQQLLAIQEELRRAREDRKARAAEAEESQQEVDNAED